MWKDNASQIDMLFYKPYADIVAQLAVETDENPLTVGVFGLWGAGKSTLLNLISQKYEGMAGKICVYINAWMFESYEDAKTAIIEALLRELEESSSVSDELKSSFKNLIKKINFFKVGTRAVSTAAPIIAGLIAGNPLPLVVNLPNSVTEIGNTIKNISDSVQGLKEDYLKSEDSAKDSVVNNVRKFRKEFEEALIDEKIGRVVVLIDDLDRCQPDRIIETLEVIKLFLSVNKTTFIIAADENVIQYAIKKKYPNIDGFNVELDKEYIEKIIQLPIQIPELSAKDIQNYMLLMVMQKYMDAEKFKDMICRIEQEKLMINPTPINLEQLERITGSINDCISFDKRDEYVEVVAVIMQIRQIAAYTLRGKFALGFHPLNANLKKKDLDDFIYLLPQTEYIGEIGLDFSKKTGIPKEKQIEYFDKIIEVCSKENKIMSVHIRGAEEEALNILNKWRPERCILHWYTGNTQTLQEFIKLGCYFSINASMLSYTENIRIIPKEKILVESDGPYSKVSGMRYQPQYLLKEYEAISKTLEEPDLVRLVYSNFKTLLTL